MKRVHLPVALVVIPAAGLGLAACSTEAESGGGEGPLTIYATTGYLADTAAHIAPEAEITTMVGPGGDPHTYQPTTPDIQKLRDSDAVLWNGLNLEAQMTDQLSSLGESQVAVGEELPEEMLLPGEDDYYDPHIWNSSEAWSVVIDVVADHLREIDPDNAEEYEDNAEAYQKEFADAAAEAAEHLNDLDAPRVLVTGHDAFNYFGESFDLEVHATDVISTEASLSATELSELADFIAEREVPVIFQDNQANPQAVTALKEAIAARGHDVRISDEELFADTLGPEAPVDTHIGALLHNATVISEELNR
ncbi:zinc ABC transporter substrate-binding protein [Corynebacterium yudongzhengii]|uniref:Zinc ABC transporter substrate-binding protein n=1 Tax=Corynebacterium yudongzhengii TaxID=2080740 RepID=A0A2U1T719_9CORY|nr:zinc ABC transporter substrate-binding protein [Corynebacterium yudongzhengii]AWB81330.1 zinc ABC transporter substrate-binding protein [Corynebacterium yudongzhengii]PWC01773.1 zinc ABC transporter substrate-binding protein [Corynebacterium yudongzhengii]